MIVSEIASGSPDGVTFAEEKLFLLVEAGQEEDINDTVREIVEGVKKIKHPSLSHLNNLIDSLRIPSKVTIVLAYQEESLIHFLLRGRGAVFLKREKECALLLSGVGSATGPTEPDDIFIFAGPSFLSAITLSVFTILIGKSSDDEVEQHIVSYVEQHATHGSLSLLLHNSEEVAHVHEPVIHEVPPPTLIRPSMQLPKFGLPTSFSHRLSSLSPHSKQQRMTFLVGCILLLLLIASLIFGSTQRSRATSAQRLEEITILVNQDLGEAEKLIDLSPEQAAPLLIHATDLLTQGKTEFPENSPEQKTIVDLLEKAHTLSQQARRIYKVSPEVFFDIKWLKDEGRGDKITITEEAFFLTDPGNKSIYKVGLPQKKAEIVATNDVFTQSVAIASYQNNPYIFIEGNEPKVTNSRGDTAIAKSDEWGAIKDMAGFGGNMYLLDTNGAIWKHAGAENGFGNGSRWLSDNATVDFKNAQSLAIDGSIWVLTPNEIIKLTMGGVDPFFLKGDTLTSAKQLWTSEDTKFIYILEENRIIIFDKEGKYEKQYTWDGFPDVTDFVVAESLNKILLVKDDKVFSIDIGQ